MIEGQHQELDHLFCYGIMPGFAFTLGFHRGVKQSNKFAG